MIPTRITESLEKSQREWSSAVADPASESEIRNAEQALGLTFPTQYRDFLMRFGSARVGSLVVAGVKAPEGEELDYEFGLEALARGCIKFGWPNRQGWLLISTDLSGNPIALDPEGAVVMYDHDACEEVRVADSFFEFIAELLGVTT